MTIPQGPFPRAPEGAKYGDDHGPAKNHQPTIPGLPEAASRGPEMPIPTPSRIVLYRLTKKNIEAIEKRRAVRDDFYKTDGNRTWNSGISEGDTVPLLIVKVWGVTPDSYVNGQAFLDGDDNLWVTSVRAVPGDHKTPGTFSWPQQLLAERNILEGPLR